MKTSRAKAASRGKEPAWVEDHLEGIRNSDERSSARYGALPMAWSVTEGDIQLYLSHHALTLDEVLAQELDGLTPASMGGDLAVWHDGELLAAIREGRNGMREVWRFDG